MIGRTMRCGAAAGVAIAAVLAMGRQQAPVLRIIGTNDFHGGLEPRPNPAGKLWGGAVALAGAIARARSECTPPACYSILLDAGDEFQGQAVSTIARGEPVSEIFNTIGYDAAALGNHDLDWGRDTLRIRMAQEHYPVLSANLRTTDGHAVSWISPDTIIRRGPFVIGIIGIMTTDAGTSIAAKNIIGLRFVDPVPIIDSLAPTLRARGANIVIVLAHAGGICDPTGTIGCRGEMLEDAGRFTQKIDAIIAGHRHELINTTVAGIPIVEARTAGQMIDVVDLARGGTLVAKSVRNVFVDSLPRDTTVAREISAAIAAAGPRLHEPIATIAQNLAQSNGEYPLGNLIVDGMRAAAHADFAATNETGIRAPLPAGVATYGALFDIQPFGNRLMLVTASGASMRRYFQMLADVHGSKMSVSGAVVTIDTTKPLGSRVTAVRLPNGHELDDRATYTMVISDFLATGGMGLAFPDPRATVRDLGIVDLDATIAYLRTLPQPVRAPADHRWVMK
jgi:2',3'-cyclic-nucleotide 2'-phosphodiesterase (5'-nucleotidase family)